MDAAEDHIAYQVFVSIIIAVAAVDITLQTIALPLTVSNISTWNSLKETKILKSILIDSADSKWPLLIQSGWCSLKQETR